MVSKINCACPYHRSIANGEQQQLQNDGSFMLLPSCPEDMDPDVEHILAIMWSNRIHHLYVKSDCSDRLYIDGESRHLFDTVYDLICFLERGQRVLVLSSGESVKPKRHCATNSAIPPHQTWYHPTLGPAEARSLVARQQLGSYLVHPCPSFDTPFALCIHGEDGAIGSFRIHVRRYADTQRCFLFEEFAFPSIGDMVYFYRSHSIADGHQRRYRLDIPVRSTAFVARLVKQRVQELLTTDGLRTEFKDICQVSSNTSWQKSVAQQAQNTAKNRYQNVLPFDQTRVILKDRAQDDSYINASRIRLGGEQLPEYIATQGPLDRTRADFWHMVWQEGASVLIMATREVEGRKRKCQRYWPTRTEGAIVIGAEGSPRLTVRHNGETDKGNFSVTRLLLSCNGAAPAGDSRLVHLFRYVSWPDHDVPREASSVLDLLDQADRVTEAAVGGGGKQRRPPMVVHCSAGLGRTGCLLAIDHLLQRVRANGLGTDIDVFDTVLQMRAQREGMVQNLAQYRFIYSALMMHIDSKLRPVFK